MERLEQRDVPASSVSLVNPGTQTGFDGGMGDLAISATDSNPQGTLVFSAANLPPGLSMNASNGAITGTISSYADLGGSYAASVTASDGTSSDSQTFDWDVNPYPLTVTTPSDQTNNVGDQVSLAIQDTDQAGGSVSYTASNLPDGLSIDGATGIISGAISSAASGIRYNTTVTAQDFAASGQYLVTVAFAWSVNFVVPPPVGDNDYWVAQAIPQGQTAADWGVDANWSLGRKPTTGDTAIFDGTRSTTPASLTGIAAPALVHFEGNWQSTVTVSGAGSLTTTNLNIDPRAAGAGAGQNELIINGTGQVEVMGTADKHGQLLLQGGRITGTGTLLVDQGAELRAEGISAADPPTLGCVVQLGSADGSSSGSMDFAAAAVQPLGVTGNARINLNGSSTLTFDGTPLPSNNSVTAISNLDNGTETIFVNCPTVADNAIYSDGSYQRVVGMGVQLTAGSIFSGSMTNGQPLRFTGKTTAGWGLAMTGGELFANGAIAIDQGASIGGGRVYVGFQTSNLTLGLSAASPASTMTDGAITLGGTLVAHGGFDQYGGGMYSGGATTGNVQLDAGKSYLLGAGSFYITTARMDSTVSGQLTINGNFNANCGTIISDVSSIGNHTQGLLQVRGNLTITGAIYRSRDRNPTPPQNQNWDYRPITWTGTESGDFYSYDFPDVNGVAAWTSTLDLVNKRLNVHVPNS